MAKLSKKSKLNYCKRLLINLFILVLFCNKSFGINYRSLTINPTKSYAFTNEECTFELIVPNISTKNINATVQSLPEEVTFISSTKEEILIDNKKAVSYKFVFSFSKPGKYTLPKLATRIGYGGYSLKFASIEVIENPATLKPQLFFKINSNIDKIQAEKKFSVSLFAKYFKSINEININLDENFIFTEQIKYVNLPFYFTEFNTEPTHLMDFICIPLSAGTYNLPTISASFETWNNIHQNITSTKLSINVTDNLITDLKDILQSKEFNTTKEIESSYFFEKDDSSIEKDKNFPSKDTNHLKRTKKYFVLKNIIKTIKTVSLILSICFLLIFILSIILKNKKLKTLFLIFFILTFICFILSYIFLAQKICISKGSNLYLIPEPNSNIVNYTPEGTLLKIILEYDQWIQVQFNNNEIYWIKKSDVLLEDL